MVIIFTEMTQQLQTAFLTSTIEPCSYDAHFKPYSLSENGGDDLGRFVLSRFRLKFFRPVSKMNLDLVELV